MMQELKTEIFKMKDKNVKIIKHPKKKDKYIIIADKDGEKIAFESDQQGK